jgi:hypothetical protein
MGSFADGMKMGQNAYQQSLDNERQAAKDAREKVIQGREDATYNRAQAQIADEDSAVQQYGLLTTQGKRNDAGVQANDADFDMAVQATGQGLPMPTQMPVQQEWTKATDLDKNQGLQGISRARRDWNGVASLQKEEKGLQWDQTFGQRLKDYAGTEEQIGAAAVHLNSNSKRVSMGDPDKNGIVRVSVVKPDGRADFMKLSKQDQAQLYAAAGMMEQDPQRALTIMSGVNKELAAAVAADNGIAFKLAEAGDRSAGRVETARHNRVGESNDSARLAIARTTAGQQSSANMKEFIDPKGNTVIIDLSKVAQDKNGRLLGMDGLRPKGAPREFTQKDVIDLAATYTGQPDPDAPKKQMNAQRAMQVARQELSGGMAQQGGGSVSDRLIASLPMEDPRVAPAPATPGLKGPAPAPRNFYGADAIGARQAQDAARSAAAAQQEQMQLEADQAMERRRMEFIRQQRSAQPSPPGQLLSQPINFSR